MVAATLISTAQLQKFHFEMMTNVVMMMTMIAIIILMTMKMIMVPLSLISTAQLQKFYFVMKIRIMMKGVERGSKKG